MFMHETKRQESKGGDEVSLVESQVSVDEGVCKPDPDLNFGNLSFTVYIRFIIFLFFVHDL